MADADDGIHVLKEEEFFVAVCVDCSCVGDVMQLHASASLACS
jgi:hypothetical protein